MNLKRLSRIVLAAIALAIGAAGALTTTACSTPGSTATTSDFRTKLAAGYAADATARHLVDSLLVAKVITVADAKGAESVADSARAGLDAAAAAKDPASAQALLDAATASLTNLQASLHAKETSK